MKKIITIILIFISCNIYSADNIEYGYLKLNIEYAYKVHKVELFKYSNGNYNKITNNWYKYKLKILPGKYRIIYYNEEKIAYNEFDIIKNETTYLELDFINENDFFKKFGYITVRTNPDDSGNIIVNNQKIGKSGEKIKIKTGIHKIFFRNQKKYCNKGNFSFS